ncbi:hypothetical protein AAA799D07_00347 [Marine Group I thaumarchaeote SCGC AAA799-D07]|nr:hypothetical protein AAA799D07_00347 [Marine Group I thaumarchaeote SCGC AAA799-D07]
MKEFEVTLKLSEYPNNIDLKTLKNYFDEMPLEEILAGLKFAKNRWIAKDAGVLKVGRKSILQKEIHSVTAEQAKWRLKNWKIMIANYRRRGYSYPTISRIKKLLIRIAKKSK